MTRDELADALIELRRYVRSDPEHVKAELVKLGGDLNPPSRLSSNLFCALWFIQVDPEVLEGYLYAAAFELRLGGAS